PEFVTCRLCRLHALERLLEIALAGAAARITRSYVGKELFVIDDILVRKRDKAQETHDVDIGFRGIKRDQFGAFEDTKCRSVDPRRLSPDFVDRCEAIEYDLPYQDR